MSQPTQQIVINGLSINYRVAGEGADLLLLHGWGCDLSIFKGIQENLQQHFKTYALDLPGFGESEEPKAVWGVEKYTQCVEAFIEKLGLQNPILLGHSFGGRISILMSSRRPVHKVILVDSAGVKPTRTLSYYLKVYSYKLLKKIAQIPIIATLFKDIIEEYTSNAGSSDYQQASAIMKKVLVKVVNEDLQEVMPKINASTLLIWGENDTATPVRDAKIMEKLIPDAGLVVLKNSGHYSFLEKQQEFLLIVHSFLEKDKKTK